VVDIVERDICGAKCPLFVLSGLWELWVNVTTASAGSCQGHAPIAQHTVCNSIVTILL